MTDILTDYVALAAKWRKEREETLRETRVPLLKQLRELGVAQVEVQYDGYGDSGNVHDITLTGATESLDDDLNRKIEDFGWMMAHHQHPGFENNDGGYGTLTWDIAEDKISLDHADRYVETNHTFSEDL